MGVRLLYKIRSFFRLWQLVQLSLGKETNMQHSMLNVASDRCIGSAKTRALFLPRGGNR
ncbi:hypothetical protein AERO9A_210036 [Aeromonas salmonicida]|nr:hypothetical protein AERO9A_210036 [Aeromonas salmonicida]